MKRKVLSIVFVLTLALTVFAQAAAQLDNVTDAAGLFSDTEWQTLEQRARDISDIYGVGVYIITVDDYENYADGDIYDAADALYFGYSLGLGEDQDGILLLISMEERDYNLIAYGDYAKYAFNEDGREALVDFFLDDFGDNRWYDGFCDYLNWCEDYLETAKNGEPYSEDNLPEDASDRMFGILIRAAIVLLVPLAVAGIYVGTLTAKMKSVEIAKEAVTYMSGDLDLTRESDHYVHTTTTRRKIEKEDENSSNGSSSGSSSGGGSGTSGKF